MTFTAARQSLLAASALAFLAGIKLYFPQSHDVCCSSSGSIGDWRQLFLRSLGRYIVNEIPSTVLAITFSVVFGFCFGMPAQERQRMLQKWLPRFRTDLHLCGKSRPSKIIHTSLI